MSQKFISLKKLKELAGEQFTSEIVDVSIGIYDENISGSAGTLTEVNDIIGSHTFFD